MYQPFPKNNHNTYIYLRARARTEKITGYNCDTLAEESYQIRFAFGATKLN